MEAILAATLEVPFWCSFRVPYTINVHFTYPVPPITTLYGLVACAFGYPADHLAPLEGLLFGIGIQEEGRLVETYSKIIKWDRRDLRNQMRTLVMKQKLHQPVYRMYICGPAGMMMRLAGALESPHFPLYLGESDDLVEVRDVALYPVCPVEASILHSCVPVDAGNLRSGRAMVVHLPVAFTAGRRKGWTGVQYRDYYVAPTVELDREVAAFAVEGKNVVLV
ncbi:CRISPR-associated protein Cas5 [Desulfofundulus thermobenzoicus]|uniref:CRISPR-associated protein Cas5 n=1 Tax=Desulfofundulus thermobenzoicus TaxID=29376 RepID=UPI00188364FA